MIIIMFITKIKSISIDSISQKTNKHFQVFQGKVRSQDLLTDSFVAKSMCRNI